MMASLSSRQELPCLDVGTGSVLDRLQLAAAGLVGLDHALAGEGSVPGRPIGPPGALVVLGTLVPVVRAGWQLVVEPVAVFAGSGRVDDAGDVAGAGQDELLLALVEL